MGKTKRNLPHWFLTYLGDKINDVINPRVNVGMLSYKKAFGVLNEFARSVKLRYLTYGNIPANKSLYEAPVIEYKQSAIVELRKAESKGLGEDNKARRRSDTRKPITAREEIAEGLAEYYAEEEEAA